MFITGFFAGLLSKKMFIFGLDFCTEVFQFGCWSVNAKNIPVFLLIKSSNLLVMEKIRVLGDRLLVGGRLRPRGRRKHAPVGITEQRLLRGAHDRRGRRAGLQLALHEERVADDHLGAVGGGQAGALVHGVVAVLLLVGGLTLLVLGTHQYIRDLKSF